MLLSDIRYYSEKMKVKVEEMGVSDTYCEVCGKDGVVNTFSRKDGVTLVCCECGLSVDYDLKMDLMEFLEWLNDERD